jgi:uncharacterized membrane protein YcaP (DUF421 family)
LPDWLEISLRTLMAVVILFVLTRLLGKRQVSQLSLFEYITGITIGSLAAYVSLDSDTNWWLGFLSMVVWVAVSLGMEYLQLKSKKARDMLDGKARILIENGKVLDNNLRKERITSDELLELLRKKNVFDMSQVEFAIMDTSGEVNVLLKKEHQPLTASDIGLSVKPEKIAMSVIMDGRILEHSLNKIGLNEEWLNSKLKKLGTSADRIYLAQVDSENKLYLDPFDDNMRIH